MTPNLADQNNIWNHILGIIEYVNVVVSIIKWGTLLYFVYGLIIWYL